MILLGALVMLIAADRDTGTSELEGEATCPSLDKEALCGYPGSIFTCRVVGVLLPKAQKHGSVTFLSCLTWSFNNQQKIAQTNS